MNERQAPVRESATAYRTIAVAPLTPAIGAEIEGADLSRQLADAQFEEIHAALMAHHVIFFRDQRLERAHLAAFARRFGEPQPSTESSFGKLEGYPEIDVLDYDASRPPYVTKEMWHTDFSGRERPTLGSVLYALEVPTCGGDTIWVSLAAAYDALSERMKGYLSGMKAEHRTIKAFGDEIRSNLWRDDEGRRRFEAIKALPPVEHPVVRTHPVTGRKALFVNEGYTTRLAGVDGEESDAALEQLFNHLRMPEFQCRFRWRKGSLAVWDNRITQHYAVADYTERRLMYRITIKGDRPF